MEQVDKKDEDGDAGPLLRKKLRWAGTLIPSGFVLGEPHALLVAHLAF